MIFRIVRAWWYLFKGLNKDLREDRLSICQTCDKRKGFVCGVCLCPLIAKASDEENECPHPEGNKWK